MALQNDIRKIFFITNLNKNKSEEESSYKINSLSISSILKDNNDNQIVKSINNGKGFSIYDKGYYKLNNNLNIYPSLESSNKNRLKPIIFKTGLLKPNLKYMSRDSKYYLPIMKKTKNFKDSYSFFLENTPNLSKSRDYTLKYRSNKTKDSFSNKSNNESINEADKDKNNKKKKGDNKIKEDEKSPNNLDKSVVSYSFDRFGQSKLRKNFINLNSYKYRLNQKKYDNYLDQVFKRRKNHRDQMLLRNKYQYAKYYNRRSIPFLNSDSNTMETYKLLEFNPELLNNEKTTDTDDIDTYLYQNVHAKDILNEKLPFYKVSGYDQLYMNLLAEVRPKEK